MNHVQNCNPMDLVQIHFGPPAQNGRKLESCLNRETGGKGPEYGKDGPKFHF